MSTHTLYTHPPSHTSLPGLLLLYRCKLRLSLEWRRPRVYITACDTNTALSSSDYYRILLHSLSLLWKLEGSSAGLSLIFFIGTLQRNKSDSHGWRKSMEKSLWRVALQHRSSTIRRRLHLRRATFALDGKFKWRFYHRQVGCTPPLKGDDN